MTPTAGTETGAPAARTLRIDLAYDGTDFAGWQAQPRLRTVQGAVEEALTRVQGGRSARIRGAGRTDAGVHALGQVADTRLCTRCDDARLAYSLRRLLPPDVRPTRVRTVDDRFHARRDAVSKTYRYRLDLSAHGDPMRARYALHHPRVLDPAAIRAALERLPGRRDWSGFTSTGCTVEDRVRELTEARLVRASEDEWHLVFSAEGFLQHMVRNLVGTVLEVGRGRMAPERIDGILESGDRGRAGPTAPAHGLCLVRVSYPGD